MSAARKRCGDCNACCVVLTIDTPEFKKPGNLSCQHLTTKGCGIYEKRYPICRQFLCGWLQSDALDENWRPDKSGVLVMQVAYEKVPDAYKPGGNGVLLLLFGNDKAIARPGFAEYAMELVRQGVAVYFTIPASHALINERLAPMAKAGDTQSAVRTLTALHRLVAAVRGKKGFLHTLPHLYRLELEKRRMAARKPHMPLSGRA